MPVTKLAAKMLAGPTEPYTGIANALSFVSEKVVHPDMDIYTPPRPKQKVDIMGNIIKKPRHERYGLPKKASVLRAAGNMAGKLLGFGTSKPGLVTGSGLLGYQLGSSGNAVDPQQQQFMASQEAE